MKSQKNPKGLIFTDHSGQTLIMAQDDVDGGEEDITDLPTPNEQDRPMKKKIMMHLRHNSIMSCSGL